MVKSKLKIIVPLFYILLTFGYFIEMAIIILNRRPKDFIEIIPGETLIDLIILFIGLPILIIVPLFFVKFTTVLNFKVSRKFLKNYEFYYVILGESSLTLRSLIFRSLLPVFFALAFSHMLNDIPLLKFHFGGETVISIFIISLILAPITIFLLLPVWIFKDSGIVKIRKKQNQRDPPELTPFGKMQYQSYIGFIGITTPITYFVTIYKEFQLSNNLSSLLVLVYPFFLIGLFMPLLLIYDSKINIIGKKTVQKLNLQPLDLKTIEKNFI